jgi:hypothetical protein
VQRVSDSVIRLPGMPHTDADFIRRLHELKKQDLIASDLSLRLLDANLPGWLENIHAIQERMANDHAVTPQEQILAMYGEYALQQYYERRLEGWKPLAKEVVQLLKARDSRGG